MYFNDDLYIELEKRGYSVVAYSKNGRAIIDVSNNSLTIGVASGDSFEAAFATLFDRLAQDSKDLKESRSLDQNSRLSIL